MRQQTWSGLRGEVLERRGVWRDSHVEFPRGRADVAKAAALIPPLLYPDSVAARWRRGGKERGRVVRVGRTQAQIGETPVVHVDSLSFFLYCRPALALLAIIAWCRAEIRNLHVS